MEACRVSARPHAPPPPRGRRRAALCRPTQLSSPSALRSLAVASHAPPAASDRTGGGGLRRCRARAARVPPGGRRLLACSSRLTPFCVVGDAGQMLMGTSVSAFEQPLLAKGGGVCTDQRMDYSPLAQPCANDFAKGGMYSKDNTVSRMEVRRRSSLVPRAGKRRTAACPACPRGMPHAACLPAGTRPVR